MQVYIKSPVRFDQVQVTDVSELVPVHLLPDCSVTTGSVND